jgi:serine phosphatase RsbU (regulator of sigma subunit)/anti-sigma regulatory factor (Ser/Thr protein kinase)/tetratricopeptide (TPR) repeat protein
LFRHIVKEQLKVPANIDYLGELRDFVMKVGKRFGFSERLINAFKLSIDEAATNIIKHAYRDWSGDITIRAIVKKNTLTIVLIDQGKYFDPRQVGDPDLQRYVDIGKKGGLGIFIMRRLLDRIDYRKTEEGNELWLVKHREVAAKSKISVAAIPVSLKTKYWFISLVIFTAAMLAVYMFFFIRQDKVILNEYNLRGKSACSVLANDVSNRLQELDSLVLNQIATIGGREVDFIVAANKAINTISATQHREIMFSALIVDVANEIKAVSKNGVLTQFNVFQIPTDSRELEKDIVYKFKLQPEERGVQAEVLDIVLPVLDKDNKRLCKAHFLIDYNVINKEIKSARLSYFNLALLVWIIGIAGLFLLIYLVMNPFRRLQDWVKAMGQPGVVEEMDIDASTEVGEIAKAFSDITQKLRISQENVAEQERMQKEMQVAQEIQQTLLPGEFPDIDGYELASYYAAAKEVGGDYYDFVEVDKDTLGIVVGDVSGKGVPGSLVMTMIRTALRTEARGLKDAAEVLARVNDFVINDIKKGMFVTLFYVIIDSRRRRLNYASAGHNPMILYRASTEQTYYLNPRGFPIGISLPDKGLFRKSIESDTIALNEDDILLVYTDGITEAMNSKRQLYGEERFLNVVRGSGEIKANDFVDNLHKELSSFTEGTSQNDDITLVAIKEKTTADKIELKRAKSAYELIQEGTSIKESCEKVGITTYAYNKKYRTKLENGSIDSFSITTEEAIESKHLSIEEKTKIYDIIAHNPVFGAKKISDELLTDVYSNTSISVSRIYEELVHARLNTKELREAYVNRGGKRKRLKPPGTPLLTIDGKVIIQKTGFAEREDPPDFQTTNIDLESSELDKKSDVKVGVETSLDEEQGPSTNQSGPGILKDILEIGVDELLTSAPEDLFDKRGITESVGIENNVEDQGFDLAEEKFDYIAENPENAETVETGDNEKEHSDSPFNIEQTKHEGAKNRLLEKEAPKENIKVDGPSPIEEFYLSDRGMDPPEIQEDLEIPEWIQDTPKVVYVVESPEDIKDADEEAINDIAVDGQIDVRGKIEKEELDFTEFVLEGGGMDEPAPSEEDHSEFDESEMVEAQILYEEEKEQVYDLEAVSDLFEDFLEMEEEHGLITPSGEITPEVNPNSPELKEGAELDDVSELFVGPETTAFVEEEKTEELDLELTFEDLIDEIVQGPSFQNDDEEFDSLMEEVVVNEDEDGEDKEMTGLTKAINLYDAAEYNAAIELLEKVVEKDPQNHKAMSMLSDSLYQTKNYFKAVKSYERVLTINDKDTNALENLGIIHANRGNLNRAIIQWERLLSINPQRQDIKDSIAQAKQYLNQI